ncbi:CLUMA_CG010546, isoform A [Clunio marinus]|uniref:CLUMA_CG010546, isoform A n=1 Tax=Clunio marinus TaxID=568069 RepID=A0A1J1IA38_9DIPT|nr:CLUMA_CG010546, isoform A [Clunio marinus]
MKKSKELKQEAEHVTQVAWFYKIVSRIRESFLGNVTESCGMTSSTIFEEVLGMEPFNDNITMENLLEKKPQWNVVMLCLTS